MKVFYQYEVFLVLAAEVIQLQTPMEVNDANNAKQECPS
jgi:hypothetical protein